MVRPRIVLTPLGVTPLGKWRCHNDFLVQGFGPTRELAYANWLIKYITFTRMPRRGYWNKKDCLNWHRRGASVLRSYVGAKRISGYDPVTDELILQG